MLIQKFTTGLCLGALVLAGCDGSGTSSGSGQPTNGGTSTSLFGNIPEGATQLDDCPIAMTEMGAAYLNAMADPETGWEFVRFELVEQGTPEEEWEITQVHNAEEGDAYWVGPEYTVLVPEDQLDAIAEIKLHYGGSHTIGRGFMILGLHEAPPPDPN